MVMGIISDEEFSRVKEIKQTEDATRKNLAQLRMARFSNSDGCFYCGYVFVLM